MRAVVTDASGVPGENDNGKRVLEFCAERGICVGNTYFEYKDMLHYEQGGMAVRGMGLGLSDQNSILCKVMFGEAMD